MKKRNSIFLIAALAGISLFSCKSTKDATETPKDNSTDAPSDVTDMAEADTTVKDTTERTFFASIERTPCFGICPTYTMTIYSDGYVEYNGTRGVDMIGEYTTTISDKELKNFETQATAIGFMELEESYDGMITDLPSTTTVIVLNGVRKQVYRRYNYPQRILIFEKCFDDLLKSEKWISKDGEQYPPER